MSIEGILDSYLQRGIERSPPPAPISAILSPVRGALLDGRPTSLSLNLVMLRFPISQPYPRRDEVGDYPWDTQAVEGVQSLKRPRLIGPSEARRSRETLKMIQLLCINGGGGVSQPRLHMMSFMIY